MQALPARRDARLAGVGRARRPRRPRDAPDRRRRRRPRRRRRASPRGSAYSERHLHRLLVAEVGAGAARARPRAARADRPRADRDDADCRSPRSRSRPASRSIRQFNDTIREVFAATPTELRARGTAPARRAGGALTLRLPCRAPFDGAGRARLPRGRARCPASRRSTAASYRRTLRAARTARASSRWSRAPTTSPRRFTARDLRDLDRGRAARAAGCSTSTPIRGACTTRSATTRCSAARRRAARPAGARAPSTRPRLAVRAVLGQQVSLAAARHARRAPGRPARHAAGRRPTARSRTCSRTPAALAAAGDPSRSRCPAPAGHTLRELARRLDAGELVLERGRRPRARPRGPARRARHRRRGPPRTSRCARSATPTRSSPRTSACGARPSAWACLDEPVGLERHAERWRPWRRYAAHHLWSTP